MAYTTCISINLKINFILQKAILKWNLKINSLQIIENMWLHNQITLQPCGIEKYHMAVLHGQSLSHTGENVRNIGNQWFGFVCVKNDNSLTLLVDGISVATTCISAKGDITVTELNSWLAKMWNSLWCFISNSLYISNQISRSHRCIPSIISTCEEPG
jgi:hypothetical protein